MDTTGFYRTHFLVKATNTLLVSLLFVAYKRILRGRMVILRTSCRRSEWITICVVECGKISRTDARVRALRNSKPISNEFRKCTSFDQFKTPFIIVSSIFPSRLRLRRYNERITVRNFRNVPLRFVHREGYSSRLYPEVSIGK